MISLILLVITITLSSIVTRMGAVALEITGVDPEQASFQALSAYSGVGYTTHEAEFTLNHPQRRKIIKTLIRLGSAGVMTTLVALAGTVVSSPEIVNWFSDSPYFKIIPIKYSEMTLLLLLFSVFVVERTLSKPSVGRLIKELVTQFLVQSHWVEVTSYKELGIQANGYGVIQVDVCEKNPLLGKTLAESDLAAKGIEVLSIERSRESILHPSPDMSIHLHDRVLYYGPVFTITQACCPRFKETPSVSQASLIEDEPLGFMATAPDFSLFDQNHREVTLSQYRGEKHVILLFYPKDHSFTCSSQLLKFSAHQGELAALDTVVIAINPESAKSHRTFADKLQIQFSLLTDRNKKACKAYRALMLWGVLVNRTVYIVDKQGLICYAKRGNPNFIEVIGHIREMNAGHGVTSQKCTTEVCP